MTTFNVGDKVRSTVDLGRGQVPLGTAGVVVDVYTSNLVPYPFTVDFHSEQGLDYPVTSDEIEAIL